MDRNDWGLQCWMLFQEEEEETGAVTKRQIQHAVLYAVSELFTITEIPRRKDLSDRICYLLQAAGRKTCMVIYAGHMYRIGYCTSCFRNQRTGALFVDNQFIDRPCAFVCDPCAKVARNRKRRMEDKEDMCDALRNTRVPSRRRTYDLLAPTPPSQRRLQITSLARVGCVGHSACTATSVAVRRADAFKASS